MNLKKKLKGFFKDVYLWWRTTLRKKMPIEETYIELVKNLKTSFDSYQKLIADTIPLDPTIPYFQLIKREDDNLILEIRLGGYKCLIEAEIMPTVGILYFRTYQIVLNKEDYPKWKLFHIEELDVASLWEYGKVTTRFVVPIFNGVGLNFTFIDSLNFFGKQHKDQLANYFARKEGQFASVLLSKFQTPS